MTSFGMLQQIVYAKCLLLGGRGRKIKGSRTDCLKTRRRAQIKQAE
jgi:hypothetical protein